jgi:hypothetical protein
MGCSARQKLLKRPTAPCRRAADRAPHRKAPCHHENKDSMADAIVLETPCEAVKSLGQIRSSMRTDCGPSPIH